MPGKRRGPIHLESGPPSQTQESRCFFSARRLLNSPHSEQGLSTKRAPSKMSVASRNPFALLEGLYVSAISTDTVI